MVLTSAAYFTFLAAVFFAYWLAARYRLGALAVVLFANYYFYARWDLIYLAIIPAASTCDFLLARAMHRSTHQGTRRLFLTLSILLNVGLMASVKYVSVLPWVLPLALSFYGFQSLSYTIDVYRRDAAPADSYLAYLASASFFPTTIAGPITRLSKLVPQWSKREALTTEKGGKALFLIGMGLAKKLLIADFLAESLVNRVFDLPKLYSGFEVLAGVYGYALQLYYDFSGYTDIALGSALLLGITLPPNFNRPYSAQNISDFWRRWHMSFSYWLRDYLYFSLPGLRSRLKIFAYLNLVITMLIGGLWHGASWTFVAWGALHGVGLAAHRFWQFLRGKRKPSPAFAARFLRVFLTFHFVLIGWVLFRASSLSTARDIYWQILSGTISFANISPAFWMVGILGTAAQAIPRRWYDSGVRLYCQSPYYAQAAAIAAVIVAIRFISGASSAPFIYSRF
jgi:D-alanyl-lipoteichoic acid acyltransferase DltB (MBOAT superfamily)